MEQKLNNKVLHRIHCSVLGRIIIEDELIYELIYTNEFQRLQRIKQLGAVHFLFPTATHTRFSHSLGVYEIARRFINHFEEKTTIDPKEKQKVLVAALLHDIGHGPLSHFFEIINTKNHEEYTIEIISHPQSKINKLLKKYLSDEDIADIVKIISKTHPKKWINQLISSEIDVDRLDYLLRDGYFTGTKYVNLDIDWLINSAWLESDTIVFNADALQSLESTLLSRYYMYSRIYLNDKIEAFTHQFLFVINRIKDLLKTGYEFGFAFQEYEFLFKQTSLDWSELIQTNDDWLYLLIQKCANEKDSILNKTANNILCGNLPKVYRLEDQAQTQEFKVLIQGLINEQQYTIQTNKSNFLYLRQDDAQIEPKIKINNQIKPLSEVSIIFKSIKKWFDDFETSERKIGVIINETTDI